MQRTIGDFEREGIAVFAISYDPIEVLQAFADKHGITYSLLSDEGSAAIRRLGLFNERVYEQHAAYGVKPQERHWGTPYPSSFLLDEHGVVTARRFYQSYRERETGTGVLVNGFGAPSTIHDSEVQAQSEGVHLRAWLDSPVYHYFQRLLLSVELVIAPGLHVYGTPIAEGSLPLTVRTEPADGVVAGEASFPAPHPFRIEGLDEQLNVYEGTVLVTLPLTFTKRDAGDLVLPVEVRYQACTDNDCLMPDGVTLHLPVAAAPNVS